MKNNDGRNFDIPYKLFLTGVSASTLTFFEYLSIIFSLLHFILFI